VSDLWRVAQQRSAEFDAKALNYDRYRPRYPDGLFDDIVELGALGPGATAIEIGAGTGIATGPLADRGLQVTAIEPAPGMAAVGVETLGTRARFVVGRFEDWSPVEQVELVVACNAWHWVEPHVGVQLVAELLPSGGSFALVWTEIVSWGEEPFEDRLETEFGARWAKTFDHVLGSLRPVAQDQRFDDFQVRRHRFERTLDASTFLAVSRTYGANDGPEHDRIIRRIIDDELGGTVTKVEDAVLYLARRR
jgi:SAM-dependent methyltransferase